MLHPPVGKDPGQEQNPVPNRGISMFISHGFRASRDIFSRGLPALAKTSPKEIVALVGADLSSQESELRSFPFMQTSGMKIEVDGTFGE